MSFLGMDCARNPMIRLYTVVLPDLEEQEQAYKKFNHKTFVLEIHQHN